MAHVTEFVIGKHLSQYPIEFDSIQEEFGVKVRLLSTQELQYCGRIERASARLESLTHRSQVLKNQMSQRMP
jgi:hypothetical protein